MGGAVSSGQDNDDLINNLKVAGYIKTPAVEKVFRIVDRAHYYLPECRDSAYKDLAWKSGTLHLSAPCIYSEVMEALELKNGLSFLNLGSGTGYLNTMVGYMIGPFGINHGIELHEDNVAYANKKFESFVQISRKFDDLELCEPQFVVGNCLNLAPENHLYDRVYCGASCPPEQRETIQNMVKVNGILVIPVGDQLLKIKRISATEFVADSVLPVSFASLILPVKAETSSSLILLPDVNAMSLQCLCRITIRDTIRDTFDFSLPPVSEVSNIRRVKHMKATKFFRSEVGRHPLNILPTAQGLMLLAAFDSSDEEDEDDDNNEDSREPISSRKLAFNQQIRQRACALRARQRMASKNVAEDVDSDLSDMEDEGIGISHLKDVNGNNNGSFMSSSVNRMDSQDGGMENPEENVTMTTVPGQSGEGNGHCVRSSVLKSSDEEGSLDETDPGHPGNNSYEKIADRILTIMSPRRRNGPSLGLGSDINPMNHEASTYRPSTENAIASGPNSRSPAIEVMPYVPMHVPRTTRESYSTSADTSETSGFGSLVDDNLHMSSQQSGLGSLKDDMEPDDDGLPVGLQPTTSNKRSPQSKSSIEESSVDYDSLMADNGDYAWIDTDDEDDDSHLRESQFKKIKSFGEHKASFEEHKESNKKEDCSSQVHNDITDTSADFSVFLRAKVELLPLPSSLKAFILYYRHTGQLEDFDC